MTRILLWGLAFFASLGLAAYGAFAPPGSDALIAAGLGALALLGLAGGLAFAALVRRGRASEAAARLFRGVLAADSQAWLVEAADGRAIYANPAFRALAGAPGRVPALSDLFAAGSAAAERIEALRRDALAGTPARADLALERSGSPARWLAVVAEPVRTEAASILWRVEDITDRARVLDAAENLAAWYGAVLDHAPVGLFAADAQGRFLYVNATLARALGAAPDALVAEGRTLGTFAQPGAGGIDSVILSSSAAGESQAEVRLRGAAGESWRALVSHRSVDLDAGRRAPITLGVVRNLDGEADWQEALRHSERRFHGLFDHAPIGIALLNLEGRMVESNPSFRALVGADGESDKGRSLADLLGGADRVEINAALRAVVRGERIQLPVEIDVRAPEERELLLYLSRLDEAGGAPAGLIVHLIDNTDQKKLELQFAQAQKMQAVGQLAGGIAHDFNNLLTAILGFCDLLLMRHQAGDHSFSDIMQVKQNATRATNLVRQLLAFSRQQTIKPRVADLTDVLAELSHLLRRLIGENIELKLVHERDLWLVKVDQGPFEQVIINLAVNARDAMADGGTLTIRTRNVAAGAWQGPGRHHVARGDFVMIEISDTGSGIALELHDKIFEPFFTTKEVGAGTGLGLSTVYGIVKQFHGYIFVGGEPGEGAHFHIFLPRHEAAAPEAPAVMADAAAGSAIAGVGVEGVQAPPRDLTGAGTILLVEDEEAVRLFSARALRNKGYTVLEADCGDSALDLLNSYGQPIDLLVTDVVMPRMDGKTLVERIRSRNGNIKVIFISGYAEEDFRSQVEGESGGQVNFLPKPFSIQQLASKVKEVISGVKAA